MLACLNHYRNRPSYLTKALKRLYNLSCEDTLKEEVELRKRIVEVHNFITLKLHYLKIIIAVNSSRDGTFDF